MFKKIIYKKQQQKIHIKTATFFNNMNYFQYCFCVIVNIPSVATTCDLNYLIDINLKNQKDQLNVI